MKDAPRFLLIFAFAAIYLIWGSTYLAIRFAVETIPPLMMMGARCLGAGAVLYLWARLRGAGRPEPRHWTGALVVGGFFFLGFLLRVDLTLDPRLGHAHHLIGDPIGFLLILIIRLADLQLGLDRRAAWTATPARANRLTLQDHTRSKANSGNHIRRQFSLRRRCLALLLDLFLRWCRCFVYDDDAPLMPR